jgi:hypothetical protein
MQPANTSPLSDQPQAGFFRLSLRGPELADAVGFGAVLGALGAFGGGYGLARISAFTDRRRLWQSWAHSRRLSGPQTSRLLYLLKCRSRIMTASADIGWRSQSRRTDGWADACEMDAVRR